ncbi:uncharacterized protein CCR75_001181 [Bremia lactucae]|uniref:Uncharacterized protein n=1 Tax=Bremia lactucae TaxID=4779 RepID=A0A976ILZ0_BRELC|nr:hypothetical protein CCR75_001181 [Bremia lactucae]
MSPKRTRTSYQSALSDNVRPGGSTTMDVLIRWMRTSGNVKRWRTEPRAPLIREVVDMMQAEGLAHRQPPFVRYKLIAIEKQYMDAKKWLLETGMLDLYMKGKAAKEVRAHVDHVCPHYKVLEPAFQSIPVTPKHAETIELDEDSAGEMETDENQEEESEEEDVEAYEKTAKGIKKGDTFRDRLFGAVTSGSTKSKFFRSTETLEPILNDRIAPKKPKASVKQGKKKTSRLAKQIAPSPGYAAARKSVTTPELQDTAIASNVPSSATLSSAKPMIVSSEKSLPVTSVAPAVEIALEEAFPATLNHAPKKKRTGRYLKSSVGVASSPLNERGRRQGDMDVLEATEVMPREPEISKIAGKRVQRQESIDLTTNDVGMIERDALLKRVKDEENQRYEVFTLERAKLKCELESKRVQLLFEKAAARKKLDLLGVSQAEIDGILPL